MKLSNMIRQTASDTADFYTKVAAHIEHLESTIESLESKIVEQAKLLNADVDDHK